MNLPPFVKAVIERAVGAFTAATVAALGVAQQGLTHAPWGDALNTGGYAALLSVLLSFGKSQVGPDGPGLTETVTPSRDADVRRLARGDRA